MIFGYFILFVDDSLAGGPEILVSFSLESCIRLMRRHLTTGIIEYSVIQCNITTYNCVLMTALGVEFEEELGYTYSALIRLQTSLSR